MFGSVFWISVSKYPQTANEIGKEIEQGMHPLLETLSHDMFHMPLPIAEKIIRPVIVYLCLIIFLRLFGKRELAQLNPFDLVVLLSLSNTVQNAIIGEDNSVSGGIIGAFALLAVNWVLMKLLYRAPKLNAALQGQPSTLIRNGVVDQEELKKQTMTHEDLITVLTKNNFDNPAQIELCVLEPNGTFYMKGITPTPGEVGQHDVMEAIRTLSAEVKELRRQIELRDIELRDIEL